MTHTRRETCIEVVELDLYVINAADCRCPRRGVGAVAVVTDQHVLCRTTQRRRRKTQLLKRVILIRLYQSPWQHTNTDQSQFSYACITMATH